MGMPFRVGVDRPTRIREGIPAKLMAHLANHHAAIAALMRAIVDDPGISEGQHRPSFVV